jgi:hypothetical protein
MKIADEVTRKLKGLATAKLQMPKLYAVHKQTHDLSDTDAHLFELLVCMLRAYGSV